MKGTRRVALLVLVPLLVFVTLVGTMEWFLRSKEAPGRSAHPMYHRLAAAHAPFSKRYPHPVYGFFFPPDKGLRNALNNDIVRVSPSGFRGADPKDVGNRDLAFLVGNSVVFGFVENDSLTIAGFLNRLQDKFFFVNAGVPSWTSSQMKRRTLLELLPYRPSLVVFWGGHNDASLAFRAAKQGRATDRNSSESPERVASVFGEFVESIAPRLSARVRDALARPNRSDGAGAHFGAALTAADHFVQNAQGAYQACAAVGVSFLTVHQPVLALHARRPSGSVQDDRRDFFERFHGRVLGAALASSLPLLDLGALFDQQFAEVPVFNPSRGSDLKDQVFVDQVHLYVSGNERVAGAIVSRLRSFLEEI